MEHEMTAKAAAQGYTNGSVMGGYRAGNNAASLYGSDRLADPTTEESPLARDAKGIRQGLDRLDHVLGEMARKLEPVLKAGPPTGKGADVGQIRPNRSPFGDTLDAHGSRIQALADAVQELYSRLEV